MKEEELSVLLAGRKTTPAAGWKGWTLRLLSAAEVLDARREAGTLAREDRERALCSNACLLAKAVEQQDGRPVFTSGAQVLEHLQVREIAALAAQWAELNGTENPSPEDGEERIESLKKSLEHAPYERLKWRVLKSFGVLPASEQARALTDRDYLLCALHLILDEEERLGRLCPSCREAAESCCPVCGTPLAETDGGGNAAFDRERFEALKRGEQG